MGAGGIVADAAEEFVEGLKGDGFAFATDGAEDELGVGGIGGEYAGGGFGVAGGDAEGRVVKEGALEADAVIREGFHEGDEGRAILGAEADLAEAGAEVATGGEVAVAEAGRCEGAVRVVGWGGGEEGIAEGVEGVEAGVGGEGADGGAEEAEVTGVSGAETAAGFVRERGGGEFGAMMALRELGAAVLEVAEALLFEGGEGLLVAFEELVNAGIVGDESGFVGLD